MTQHREDATQSTSRGTDDDHHKFHGHDQIRAQESRTLQGPLHQFSPFSLLRFPAAARQRAPSLQHARFTASAATPPDLDEAVPRFIEGLSERLRPFTASQLNA